MMKQLLAFLSAIALLSACSNGTDAGDVIIDPDTHPVGQNTGKLLSLDGSRMHIAYSYDAEGRVTYAERFDSTWSVVKMISEYRYDADRIYITFQEFEELPNGEHNMSYSRDLVRDDTLFLLDGRVDSCAGAMRNSRNCFFYKFRYNERGELISVRNDNILRGHNGKLAEKPWYTELFSFDWQDGNVSHKTIINPIEHDTTEVQFSYSALTGTLVLSDPRDVLYDFEPLIQSNCFGKSCKNIPDSYETKELAGHVEYLKDERGMLCKIMSNVIWNNGASQDYAYSIQWE